MPLQNVVRSTKVTYAFAGVAIGASSTFNSRTYFPSNQSQLNILQISINLVTFVVPGARALVLTITRPGFPFPVFTYNYPIGTVGTTGAFIETMNIPPGLIVSGGLVSGYGQAGINIRYGDIVTITDTNAVNPGDLTTTLYTVELVG